MFVLLDGKKTAKILREELKEKISNLEIKPKLVVIQIGEDKASSTYVKNKSKACLEVGVIFKDLHFNSDISWDELNNVIKELNQDTSVDGIIIQQPLPNHLKGIEQNILPSKDVDGFTYKQLGAQLANDTLYTACTTKGICDLLAFYNIDVTGKHVVILGRSNIVGKPTAAAMLNRNATVTVCHSKTPSLEHYIEDADILIVAIGKPKFIDSSYLTLKTKVIIDVGINRLEDGTLCGDCDYNDITRYWNNSQLTEDRYITPVPGGIGPMTIYGLLYNTYKARLNHNKIY